MTDTNHTDSIQQAVLEKVRAGKVRRRPRAQFIFRIIATVLVSILLFATAAFVVSFIIFGLHESGEQFLLGFGLHGIGVFFQLFPWVEAILVLLLLILLQWLLQGFRFGYRFPLLNAFIGIIGISIVLGVVINFTPLHTMLLGSADRDQLPLIGGSYEHLFDSHEDRGVCRGVVSSVEQNTFVLQHDDHDHSGDDGTFTISIPTGSDLPVPHLGDNVLVVGDPDQTGCSVAEHLQILSRDSH